ncbi:MULTISPECIES: YhjD/YihY/BrkB family envelope integrity protein [Streptomyces]|uniref:YhjD/YihY/BrkB family envelope integrity protein n=1 Tax=Streptomyces TaxID=1883 RepID=UPI001D03DC03|nr:MULTISPECIES: YhjD/YihY/BrkB family envelope integrity protein [Streptomyces]
MSRAENERTERAGGRRWWLALRRTPVSLWRDDIDHWAAALTYYSVLAVFPTLFVALSLIGMAHPAAGPELIGHVSALVPSNSRKDVYTALTDVTEQRSAAWVLIVVGVASAVLAAYNYLSIFRRVLHAMHGVADRRPPIRAIPRTTLTALGLLGLLVASAAVLILTSEAVRAIGRVLDLGEGGSTAWTVFKWPLLVALVAMLVMVVFRTGPESSRAPHRALPGGALAVLLWLVASAGFALYASHVPTYNRLYGSLAGIVVFLVWLWVSNLALLAGAQFNAELSACAAPREAAAGAAAEAAGSAGERAAGVAAHEAAGAAAAGATSAGAGPREGAGSTGEAQAAGRVPRMEAAGTASIGQADGRTAPDTADAASTGRVDGPAAPGTAGAGPRGGAGSTGEASIAAEMPGADTADAAGSGEARAAGLVPGTETTGTASIGQANGRTAPGAARSVSTAGQMDGVEASSAGGTGHADGRAASSVAGAVSNRETGTAGEMPGTEATGAGGVGGAQAAGRVPGVDEVSGPDAGGVTQAAGRVARRDGAAGQADGEVAGAAEAAGLPGVGGMASASGVSEWNGTPPNANGAGGADGGFGSNGSGGAHREVNGHGTARPGGTRAEPPAHAGDAGDAMQGIPPMPNHPPRSFEDHANGRRAAPGANVEPTPPETNPLSLAPGWPAVPPLPRHAPPPPFPPDTTPAERPPSAAIR